MKSNIFKEIFLVFFKFFRTKRMGKFEKEFNLSSQLSVLDVGGTELNWTLLSFQPNLTLINVKYPKISTEVHPVNKFIADGRYLPFKDASFDIVFSNSVIEHLSSFNNQTLFANECRRVGINYYIQTPNKWFPIEPHYFMLFIHWLPRRVQRKLIRNFTVLGWLSRPSQIECDRMIEELRLLSKREFQLIFPDADIWHEKFLGLTKSMIAVKIKD